MSRREHLRAAIDNARDYGLRLEPWQADTLRAFLECTCVWPLPLGRKGNRLHSPDCPLVVDRAQPDEVPE